MKSKLAAMITLASFACASASQESSFAIPSAAEQAVRKWQEENQIVLSEDARQLLIAQAEETCSNCTSTYHLPPESEQSATIQGHASATTAHADGPVSASAPPKKKKTELAMPPSGEFRRALYEYYLDQLRDLNTVKGKSSVIEAMDITKYPFTSFLRDLGLLDGPSTPMGRLIVQSQPRSAFIRINGSKRGYTDKRFVVQAGKYDVGIYDPEANLSCSMAVEIGPFETKTVSCAPGS